MPVILLQEGKNSNNSYSIEEALFSTGNYAFYTDYIKWYLSFIMMAGRLEIYTVLVLFSPKFWKR